MLRRSLWWPGNWPTAVMTLLVACGSIGIIALLSSIQGSTSSFLLLSLIPLAVVAGCGLLARRTEPGEGDERARQGALKS